MTIGKARIKEISIVALSSLALLAGGCTNPPIDQRAAEEAKKADSQQAASGPDVKPTTSATITVDVVVVDEARESSLLDQVMQGVNDIYRQCNIAVSYKPQSVSLPPTQIIDRETRIKMVDQYKGEQAALFLVPRTAEADVAFAYIPSRGTPLASSIWMTERVSEDCLPWIAAHEIGHVLLDSGRHSNGSSNVMSNGCTVNNWSNSASSPRWTIKQCLALHRSPFLKP